MTDNDPIRRKKRWEAFYNESGGFRDMILTLQATYLQHIIDADPRQVAVIANMKIAHKIAVELDGLAQSIIADGKVAEAATAHAEKIAAIPDHKRRWVS